MSGRAALAAIASFTLGSLGCPGPRTPRVQPAGTLTIAIGRDGGSLRGVASDGRRTFAAITQGAGPPMTAIEARSGSTLAWSTLVAGRGGSLAVTGDVVVATLGGTGTIGVLAGAGGTPSKVPAVTGEPGAVLVALDAATGAVRWRNPLHASEWVVASAMTAAPDGVIVGGSFSGSLRAGDRVVSSGGKSDGFIAKLTPTGEVAWLVRVGGSGPDAVQGVAVRDGQIAIAGTFAAGADLLGQPLTAFDDKSPYTDDFVATLDANGGRRWVATFGGKLADTVAGVAIDAAGHVVVAANARDVIHVGGADLVAQGLADGLVAWWTKDGTASHAVLLGGPDFDGLRAITAAGERIVVAGFYSGAMQLGDRAISAGGGDDAFLAALDERGAVVEAWEVGGVGREEVTSLAEVPAGFIAGVAYTAAASLAGAALPAPKDPLAGAALVVRAVR